MVCSHYGLSLIGYGFVQNLIDGIFYSFPVGFIGVTPFFLHLFICHIALMCTAVIGDIGIIASFSVCSDVTGVGHGNESLSLQCLLLI